MLKTDSPISEKIKGMKQANFSIELETIVKELVNDLDITLVEEQIQCLLILRNRVATNEVIQDVEQKKIIDGLLPITNNNDLLAVIVGLLDNTILDDFSQRDVMLAFLEEKELEEIMSQFQDRKDIITSLEKLFKANNLSGLEENIIRKRGEENLLKDLVDIFKIGGNSSSIAIQTYLSSLEDLDIEKNYKKIAFLAKLAVDLGDNDSITSIYNLFLDYVSKKGNDNLITYIERVFTGMEKDLTIQYKLDKSIYNIEYTGVQDSLTKTLIDKIKINLGEEEENREEISSYAILLKSIVEMAYYKKLHLNADYIIEKITKIIHSKTFDNLSKKSNEDIYKVGYNLGLAILCLDAMKPKTIDPLDVKRAEVLCDAITTPLEGPVGMNK